MGAFVPYVVRMEVKRNIQRLFPHIPLSGDRNHFNIFYKWLVASNPFSYNGPESFATMIRNVAKQVGDAGQTEVDIAETVDVSEILCV